MASASALITGDGDGSIEVWAGDLSGGDVNANNGYKDFFR